MPANVNVGPSDADRYGWPGPTDGALAAEATRIARQIARARPPVVALLPVYNRKPLDDRLAPLMLSLASALLGFADGDVALIDTWQTWPWGEAVEWGQTAAHRSRWLRPRILEIAPVPCGDSSAAAVALQNALAARPKGLMTTLVNLGGYAAPRAVPSALRLADATVLVVAVRRTRKRAVANAAAHVPEGRLLGAILIG
ncbi:MAG TPA: hypothetical protein VKQ32_25040 [Polyangia bacterium]|nr:hypothetical protein [Polyangia bacterium]